MPAPLFLIHRAERGTKQQHHSRYATAPVIKRGCCTSNSPFKQAAYREQARIFDQIRMVSTFMPKRF